MSKGKLSGTMNGGFPAPYPYKNLVVTLKTNDGVLHPFPVSEPSSFAADQSFDSLVTTTITSGVSLVSARWDDANGNPVTQDSIPFE